MPGSINVGASESTTAPRLGRRSLLAVVTAALLVSISVPAALAGDDLVQQAKAATARFNSTVRAEMAGYGPFPAGQPLHECIMSFTVDDGGMGIHWVNGALLTPPLDAEVDELTPEVLVYAPRSNGSLELVALEYVIFDSAVPAGTTPSVFGEDLTLVPAGNRYGIPAFWQRHIWLYENNDAGLFADFNPAVSC